MKGKVLRTIRNIFDGVMIFLLFITTTVYALPSDGVIYDNSTSGQAPTNVNDALNDLYSKLNEKQNEINNINNIGTAGANHILSGYTAYVKGKTITGSIPNKGATTYTPGTANQTIAAGQYLSGIQTIKGDTNLIAANIAKGKTIFGVAGTLKRVLEWENTANGSYKFEKSGDRWIANNRGVNSSTATSTWKVNVASATTAYLSYRTATESPDKLSITLNGSTVLSATGGLKTSETSITLNLVAGENTLVATYTKDSSVHSYGDMAYVVLPVVGEQGGQYRYQSKSVSASTSSQTIYPDSGYDGLSSVTVGSYSCPTCPSSNGISGTYLFLGRYGGGYGAAIIPAKKNFTMKMITGSNSGLVFKGIDSYPTNIANMNINGSNWPGTTLSVSTASTGETFSVNCSSYTYLIITSKQTPNANAPARVLSIL